MIRRKDYFHTIKIRTRIILVYITVLILSFILSFGFFTLINERKVEKEVGNAAMQTVNALKGNLNFIFENVTQFSDLIYFDREVQEALSKVSSSSIDPAIYKTIQDSLINMLLSGDYISSVFVFDNYRNPYFSYKSGPIFANQELIETSNWYADMKKAGGDVLFIHQSEGVLSFSQNNKNYITLIREISDVDTYKPLAILMINVDEKTIQEYFDEVGKEYDSRFYIIDSQDNFIVKPSEYDSEMNQYILEDEKNDIGYRTITVGNQKMILVQQELGIEDWKLIGTLPINNNITMDKTYSSYIILVISLNLIFVFACSIVLTKLIFNPLNKVQKHMQLVDNGQLVKMEINERNWDEISHLKKVFNQMIGSIQDLIEKVKKEEKIITKNELDIIQAQINPHFLYNTLDAVSALALIGDNENCLKVTQALGNFYRNSLNSGLDLVKIEDEIECIKSYITILNIRYDNKIIMVYDIEEEIKEYKVLKLILQPIVENAAHHGIRNKKGQGTISIKGYLDEDEIIFIVTDDGLGMTEEKVKEILEGKTKQGKSGFGLYSSIQRISLYYDIKKPITITSEIGNVTEITIRVKVIKEVSDNENKSITG